MCSFFHFPQLIYPAVLSFLATPSTTPVDCFEPSATVKIARFSIELDVHIKGCGRILVSILHIIRDFFGLRNHAHNGHGLAPIRDLGTNCTLSTQGTEMICPSSTHEMETTALY